jgi:hypothetical protein
MIYENENRVHLNKIHSVAHFFQIIGNVFQFEPVTTQNKKQFFLQIHLDQKYLQSKSDTGNSF